VERIVPFQDVIDNYGNGQTGTITTADGATVGYIVTSTVSTQSRPNTDMGAVVSGDGNQTVEVTFDQPVEGLTIKFDRSNQPEIYRITIDGVEVDIQDLIDSGQASFTTVIVGTNPVQTGTHIIQDGGVTSTGVPTNNSLGFLTIHVPVESIGVFGTGGGSGTFDLIEIGIDSETSGVVCFAADTELLTPDGPRRVSDLKAGDRLITRTGQIRRIVATNVRHVSPIELFRDTRLLPVCIAAGALGGGLPERDLYVSRQHRILVSSRIARRICGHDEVLIPAFRLVGIPGIDIARTITPISYHHVLLEGHDIVLANGAPAETLFLGPVSTAALAEDGDGEDCEVASDAIVPGVRQDASAPMRPARPFATARQARQIVAAHIRHGRPLLEGCLCLAA
jgi:hypothetical protein